MGLKDRIFPKGVSFYQRLSDQAAKTLKGIEALVVFVENPAKENAKRVRDIEREADELRRVLVEDLHQTYITPMDREDIYALVNKMDSILDMTESAAARMHLYKVKHPCVEILDQIRVLNQAVAKIKKIVHAMRNMKNAEMILKACVEINTLENEGDAVLRTAVANLFERESDALEVIKKKEILERLEEAIDACEDVSNIVEGIVLKNA